PLMRGAGLEAVCHEVADEYLVLGIEQVADVFKRAAQNLLLRKGEHGQAAGIDIVDSAVGVGCDYTVADGGQRGLGAFLLLVELALDVDQARHIAAYRFTAEDAAVAIID